MSTFEPLSVKLTIHISLDDFRNQIAREHNIDPSLVEIIVDATKQEAEPDFSMFPQIEEEEHELPEHPFNLGHYLKENKLSRVEAAELCGVSLACIGRLCAGFVCRDETFNKVTKGLCMNPETTDKFYKSLTKHQHDYETKENK